MSVEPKQSIHQSENLENLNDKLDYHRFKYRENRQIYEKKRDDFDEINRITKFFTNNKAKIIKLNHNLDGHVQAFTQYEGFMQIEEALDLEPPFGMKTFLRITNKKPNNNPKFILEADPYEVE